MSDDQPVFKPIPQPKELTAAEKQAKWEAKQRKKRPGFRYVVLNPHVPYEKKGYEALMPWARIDDDMRTQSQRRHRRSRWS